MTTITELRETFRTEEAATKALDLDGRVGGWIFLRKTNLPLAHGWTAAARRAMHAGVVYKIYEDGDEPGGWGVNIRRAYRFGYLQ